MRSLVDDLRRAPTPEVFQSRTRLVDAMKRAHIALVRMSLDESNDWSLPADLAALRDYALWLEGMAVQNAAEAAEYYSLAASIYEFTGTLTYGDGSFDIFVSPLNDLLRSAIVSSLTAFQAHSTLIGGKVLSTLEAHRSHDPVEQIDITAALTIAALLKRDFPLSFRYSQRLTDLANRLVEDEAFQQLMNAQKLHLDRVLALGHACGLAALGMLVGGERLIGDAAERLQAVRARSLHRGDASLFWLADRLTLVIRAMAAANIRMLLAGTHLPSAYADTLARDGFHEFWQPQLEAIQKGLLNTDRSHHFVISVPTGSGKSLFAEMAILSALIHDPDGWAVYVAPSRALVGQVSSDLRHRLERCNITVRTVIAGAEQSATLDEELTLLGMGRSVTVTTPEKLDAYYRNARDLFDTCKVIVFDEAHKIGDAGRGALLESLITRFLLLQPGMQILTLSGMMDNAPELAAWLGDSETKIIATAARATRQIFAVAVRTELLMESRVHTSAKGQTRGIGFSGGLVFVHERSDLEGTLHVDLPTIFQGSYRERFDTRRLRWREDRSLTHSSPTDHAVSLAVSLTRARGTILVFVSSVPSAVKGCREFLAAVSGTPSRECEQLARFISDELGAEHELVDFCRRGAAYHHARLPANVQRALELSLQEGWLRAVFATPTLREGINTAVTTVIVAGTHLYNPLTEQSDDLAEADFLNIAGRAGRPRVETEGRVILIPDSLIQAVAAESGKKYILAGDATMRVLSQFREVADDIGRSSRQFVDLTPAHQSLLLALEAAGLTEEDQIIDFFSSTLWARQDELRDPVETASVLAKCIRDARVSVGPERFTVASKLGLSLSSAEQLTESLSAHAPLFTGDVDGDERRTSQLALLLTSTLVLPEIARGGLYGERSQIPLRTLVSWLAGDPYPIVLGAGVSEGIFKVGASVTDAVRYCADMSTWLSWAFGAAYSILKTAIRNIDPYIGALPLLVRYGVPDVISAYIALLGIADRTVSRRLAEGFTQSGHAVTLSEVSRWLNSEDLTAWFSGEDDDSVRLQLIRRQMSRRRGRDLFVQVEFNAYERVRQGAVYTCHIHGEDVEWLDKERVVATSLLDRRNRSFLGRGSEDIVGVVSEMNYNRRSGIITMFDKQQTK